MEENSKNAKKMAWLFITLIVLIGIVLILGIVVIPKLQNKDEEKDTSAKSKVSNSQENKKTNKNVKTVTEDLEMTGFMSMGRKTEYYVYVENDEEDEDYGYQDITINSKDYDLPSNLYQYKDNLLLRVTYSPEDYEVYDCIVVDRVTGKKIEDLSEENIEKEYSLEYGKEIIEKEWTDTIQLSTLKENEIYKFETKNSKELPKIVNDTGKNCVIYTKDYEDGSYEKTINTVNSILSDNFYTSSYESDVYYVMYYKAENSEILDLIEDDKLITLSDFKNGDNLEYVFEEYIYNDNKFPVNLIIENGFFEEEKTTETVTIEAGEICGFDWMIDSAKVEY